MRTERFSARKCAGPVIKPRSNSTRRHVIKRFFAALLLCLAISPALATLTFRITEEGGNVVVRATGTVNTASLTAGIAAVCTPTGFIAPAAAIVCVGGANAQTYTGLGAGPANFGGGGPIPGTSASGDAAFIAPPVVYLPVGYVSGSPISGSSTFAASTFASLGITPGTYLYPIGAGPTADAVIVVTGAAPAPGGAATIPTLSEWGMIFLAALMTGVAALRMRRGRLR